MKINDPSDGRGGVDEHDDDDDDEVEDDGYEYGDLVGENANRDIMDGDDDDDDEDVVIVDALLASADVVGEGFIEVAKKDEEYLEPPEDGDDDGDDDL